MFDLLYKKYISRADREKLKQPSRSLLPSLQALIGPMESWTQNVATQAQVKVLILDDRWNSLPRPPFTEEETEDLAERLYEYVWQRTASGEALVAA